MSSSSGGGELATWKGRVTDVIFSGGFDTKKVKLRRHMKVKDEPLLSANLGHDWCNRNGCGGLQMRVVAILSDFKRFVRLVLRLEIGAFAGYL